MVPNQITPFYCGDNRSFRLLPGTTALVPGFGINIICMLPRVHGSNVDDIISDARIPQQLSQPFKYLIRVYQSVYDAIQTALMVYLTG